MVYFPIIWPYFGIESLNVLHLHRFLFVTPLLFLIFFPFAALSKDIVCDEESPCDSTTIDCGITDSCNIYCNATKNTAIETLTCFFSTIICNQTNHCALLCSNDDCYGATLFCGEECTISATQNAFRVGTVILPNSSNSTIECNGYESCEYIHFVAGHDSIVDIQCNGELACQWMRMNVSSDSRVDLQCEGSDACITSTIYAASSQNTSLNVTCHGDNDTHDVYFQSKIIGGANSSIDMACINGPNHCVSAEVHGDANSSINVICSSPSATNSHVIVPDQCIGKIVGGKGSHINVSCIGHAHCNGMEIDGRDAASLTLSNCTGDVTCDETSIWCPQHMPNGEKKCILEGGDNLQITSLYAVNSWDDIEFITPKRCQWDISTMHCTDYYNASCTFGGADPRHSQDVPMSDEWQCVDNSSRCYVEQPTAAPTYICPIISPTASPTEASTSTPHSSTDRIVIIVLAVLCGVLVIAVVILVVMMVRKKETGPDPEAIPLSEESDAFMQSDNQ